MLYVDMPVLNALLRRLGITANYTGFSYIAYALRLTTEKPERLLFVTKWLYPDIAARFGTTASCVERNIRTAVTVCWSRNRGLLEALAQHPLPKRPKAAQFLAILTSYFFPDTTA